SASTAIETTPPAKSFAFSPTYFSMLGGRTERTRSLVAKIATGTSTMTIETKTRIVVMVCLRVACEEPGSARQRTERRGIHWRQAPTTAKPTRREIPCQPMFQSTGTSFVSPAARKVTIGVTNRSFGLVSIARGVPLARGTVFDRETASGFGMSDLLRPIHQRDRRNRQRHQRGRNGKDRCCVGIQETEKSENSIRNDRDPKQNRLLPN